MEQLADGVWQVIGADLRMPGGVLLPSRSTLLELPSGNLLIYSPVAFDDATAAQIDALGKVTHLVVPSLLHHMFAPAAAGRWRSATVHAPAGIEDKQAALQVDRKLGTPAPAWGDAIEVEVIGGAPKANEAVLFHKPSRTLLCADLLFNITRPANRRTRAVLAMMGVGGGELAQSRLWNVLRKDREAARASIERILAWPIARVAPCHGEPVAIDAAQLATRLTRLA